MAGGDGDLKLYEIEAGDLLGDRMFDLQTRVHFQKIKIEVGVDQEFDSAGVDVAAGAREAHRGVAHFLAQVGRDDWRGRLFDHFLMAPLDGAFPLTERDDAAVSVGENLDFHVMGPVEIFFEVKAVIAKCVHGFGGSISKRGFELGVAVDNAHALAAATGDGFEQNGIAHAVC